MADKRSNDTVEEGHELGICRLVHRPLFNGACGRETFARQHDNYRLLNHRYEQYATALDALNPVRVIHYRLGIL
jgi:hypothetical protein